jgi:hypothetical protein
VNRNARSHYGGSAAYRRAHDAISRPDQSERETTLGRGAALIIVVLASLGFWWAIWVAVSLLASVCCNRIS